MMNNTQQVKPLNLTQDDINSYLKIGSPLSSFSAESKAVALLTVRVDYLEKQLQAILSRLPSTGDILTTMEPTSYD